MSGRSPNVSPNHQTASRGSNEPARISSSPAPSSSMSRTVSAGRSNRSQPIDISYLPRVRLGSAPNPSQVDEAMSLHGWSVDDHGFQIGLERGRFSRLRSDCPKTEAALLGAYKRTVFEKLSEYKPLLTDERWSQAFNTGLGAGWEEHSRVVAQPTQVAELQNPQQRRSRKRFSRRGRASGARTAGGTAGPALRSNS